MIQSPGTGVPFSLKSPLFLKSKSMNVFSKPQGLVPKKPNPNSL
jgi:hypothetical protein